jgi:uncharacterized protein YbbK (DUF523 family)
MKNIVLRLLVGVLSITTFFSQEIEEKEQEQQQQQVTLNWEDTFKAALKKSKKEKKSVFIYFTDSDCCGSFKVLDKKPFSYR